MLDSANWISFLKSQLFQLPLIVAYVIALILTLVHRGTGSYMRLARIGLALLAATALSRAILQYLAIHARLNGGFAVDEQYAEWVAIVTIVLSVAGVVFLVAAVFAERTGPADR